MAKHRQRGRPKSLRHRHHLAPENRDPGHQRKFSELPQVLHAILHQIRQLLHPEIRPKHLQMQAAESGRSRGTVALRYPHVKNGSAQFTIDQLAD